MLRRRPWWFWLAWLRVTKVGQQIIDSNRLTIQQLLSGFMARFWFFILPFVTNQYLSCLLILKSLGRIKMTESILQIKDLKKSFGDNTSPKASPWMLNRWSRYPGFLRLWEIDLAICINGLRRFKEATFSLMASLSPAVRRISTWFARKIGMVFQSYDLFPHLDILQKSDFGAGQLKGVIRKKSLRRLRKLLNRVGLLDKHSFARQLSGGQKQRCVRSCSCILKLSLTREVLEWRPALDALNGSWGSGWLTTSLKDGYVDRDPWASVAACYRWPYYLYG